MFVPLIMDKELKKELVNQPFIEKIEHSTTKENPLTLELNSKRDKGN